MVDTKKTEEGVARFAVGASAATDHVVRFHLQASVLSHYSSCSDAPSTPLHHPITFFSHPWDRHPPHLPRAVRRSVHVRIEISRTCIDTCCFHSTSLEGHVGGCLQIHLVVNVGAKRGERGNEDPRHTDDPSQNQGVKNRKDSAMERIATRNATSVFLRTYCSFVPKLSDR